MRARKAKMLVAVAVAALALAGCQSLFPRKPVLKPVPPPPTPVLTIPKPAPLPPPPPPPPPPAPKACVPKTLGAPPRYPDTDAALRSAGGAADRYQLLAAGRILRQERLEELERVIAGCR